MDTLRADVISEDRVGKFEGVLDDAIGEIKAWVWLHVIVHQRSLSNAWLQFYFTRTFTLTMRQNNELRALQSTKRPNDTDSKDENNNITFMKMSKQSYS